MALQNPIINPPTISTGGMHKKYTVGPADLAKLGAFTSGDIILDYLPAGAVVRATRVKHSAAVVGASVSAATARVITANNNYGSGTLDVFAAPGTTSGTHFITDIAGANENFAAVTPLLLHVTSTGANLSVVTAGSIDVWVDYTVLA